jgi:hypothetical protein
MKYLHLLILLVIGLVLSPCWCADAAGDYVVGPPTVIGTAATAITYFLGILGALMPILATVGKVVGPEIVAAHPALAGPLKLWAALLDFGWTILASRTHIAADTAMVTQSKAFTSLVSVIGQASDPAVQPVILAALSKLPSTERDAFLAALQAIGHQAALPAPAAPKAA